MRLAFVMIVLGGCMDARDGRFVGTASTEQGSCGLGFDGNGRAEATLLLRGADAQYVPSGGVVTLAGHVDGAGHVVASSSVLGADKKPFLQVFEGVRDGAVVKGRFATPRCRAVVTLERR